MLNILKISYLFSPARRSCSCSTETWSRPPSSPSQNSSRFTQYGLQQPTTGSGLRASLWSSTVSNRPARHRGPPSVSLVSQLFTFLLTNQFLNISQSVSFYKLNPLPTELRSLLCNSCVLCINCSITRYLLASVCRVDTAWTNTRSSQ